MRPPLTLDEIETAIRGALTPYAGATVSMDKLLPLTVTTMTYDEFGAGLDALDATGVIEITDDGLGVRLT